MYSNQPNFAMLALVNHFFVAKSGFTSCYLLRCRADYPKKKGAIKSESTFRYIAPLVPSLDESTKSGAIYAERYANLYTNQVVTFDGKVFHAETAIITFGKYAGKSLSEVVKLNSGYLYWLAKNMTPKNIDQQRILLQCQLWSAKADCLKKVI